VTERLEELLEHLEVLLAEVEALDEPARSQVFELLDGIDALHRSALLRLAEALGSETVHRARGTDPSVAWLLDAYGIGVDERSAAEQALAPILPYIHSHGGRVDVLDAREGVVRLRMAGACAGCTASAITLQQGVEEALRDGFPGFARIEVEEDTAPAHPPPGATLLPLAPRPG
jgi:Fe-S cluster biogenesis protein NfuA